MQSALNPSGKGTSDLNLHRSMPIVGAEVTFSAHVFPFRNNPLPFLNSTVLFSRPCLYMHVLILKVIFLLVKAEIILFTNEWKTEG